MNSLPSLEERTLFWKYDREVRQVGIITLVYILLLLFVARFDEFNFLVNRVFSPLFVVFVIYKYLKRPASIPPETLFFTLFILWSATGIIIAKDSANFWRYYKLTFQVGILLASVAYLTARFNILRWVMLAFLVNSLLYFFYSSLSGELIASIVETGGHYRLSSLVQNANGYSYALLLGSMSCFYFYGLTREFSARLLLLTLIGLLLVGIVFSASRKTYITLVVFVILYTVLYSRVKGRNSILTGMALASIGAIIYYVTSYVLQNSFLGARFQQLQYVENLTIRNTRYWLYIDGFKMLWLNPLLGVGMGQFKQYTAEEAYAHSDFLEVLSTTGFVGLFLYGMVYAILIWRIVQLRRASIEHAPDYETNFIFAAVVSLLLMSLGRPNFLDIFTMPYFAAFIGYTYRLYLQRKRMRPTTNRHDKGKEPGTEIQMHYGNNHMKRNGVSGHKGEM